MGNPGPEMLFISYMRAHIANNFLQLLSFERCAATKGGEKKTCDKRKKEQIVPWSKMMSVARMGLNEW